MRRRIKRCLSLVVALLLVMSIMPMAAYAQEVTDQAVADVIEQLESIDTLAQMQAKRGDYKVNSRYMANTTDEAIITAHETARQNYESARLAALLPGELAQYNRLEGKIQTRIREMLQ